MMNMLAENKVDPGQTIDTEAFRQHRFMRYMQYVQFGQLALLLVPFLTIAFADGAGMRIMAILAMFVQAGVLVVTGMTYHKSTNSMTFKKGDNLWQYVESLRDFYQLSAYTRGFYMICGALVLLSVVSLLWVVWGALCTLPAAAVVIGGVFYLDVAVRDFNRIIVESKLSGDGEVMDTLSAS